jgi:hypothetical protein
MRLHNFKGQKSSIEINMKKLLVQPETIHHQKQHIHFHSTFEWIFMIIKMCLSLSLIHSLWHFPSTALGCTSMNKNWKRYIKINKNAFPTNAISHFSSYHDDVIYSNASRQQGMCIHAHAIVCEVFETCHLYEFNSCDEVQRTIIHRIIIFLFAFSTAAAAAFALSLWHVHLSNVEIWKEWRKSERGQENGKGGFLCPL